MTEATGSTVEEVVTSPQCNINQLNDWFKHNHLTVNASKCCTMLIGTHQRIGDFVSLPTIGLCLDGVQITNSNTYTYLGVLRSARIITKLYGYDLSGLSIVKMLGWLNVKQRYDFLFCSLIHKCLFGTVPSYLSDNLVKLDDVQQRDTRLTGQNMLDVPFFEEGLYFLDHFLFVVHHYGIYYF